AVAILGLIGVLSYGGVVGGTGELARAESSFFLKYLLSGQSATMWMCVLFFAATTAYLSTLFRYRDGTPAIRPALTMLAVTGVLGGGFWFLGSSGMLNGVQF